MDGNGQIQDQGSVQVSVEVALDYARFEARIRGMIQGLEMALALRREMIFSSARAPVRKEADGADPQSS